MRLSLFLLGLLPVLAALSIPASVQAQSSAILPVPLRPKVDVSFRSCDQVTASGLGYKVLRPGTGRRVQLGDVVVVNYIMYSGDDGAIFDEGVNVTLPVDGLIPGATEGLQLAAQGGVYRFCIPAGLGYGASGVGPIPVNANLVFQAEVTEVTTRQTFEQHKRAD